MSPKPKLTKALTAQIEDFLDTPAKVVLRDNDGDHGSLPDDGRPSTRSRSNLPRVRRRRFAPPASNSYPSSSQRSLPAQRDGSRILEAIAKNENDANNNFTLLIGATGCGKSTQLPQLLLTAPGLDATNNNNDVEQTVIIVAQPRRLAAVSLAQRVSQELQTKLGEEVGYIIRGENRTSDATVCTFVTYGVLLKMLLDGANESSTTTKGGTTTSATTVLPGVTHLVLDEVHERSSDFDLILLFLKRCNLSGNGRKLSVTLMSATVDPASFESYLPGLKLVSVEGRSFPVTRHYLEDAMRDTNYVEQMEDKGRAPRRSRASLTDDACGATDTEKQISELTEAIAAASAEGHAGKITTLTARRDKLVALAEAQKSGGIGASTVRILGRQSLAEMAETYQLRNTAVARSLRSMNHDVIPNALIEKIIEKHCRTDNNDDGDILVFLPGVKEIEDLRYHLDGSSTVEKNIHVLPLHANLHARDQLAAFDPPPQGKTKVILATDIAEASITIPTVTLVIDAGLSRCVLLDPATSLPHLTTVMASRSSLKQRAGRAGRVKAGKCYHLIISPLLSELEPEPMPEMLTIPLDTVGLRARVALEAAGGEAAARGTTETILGGCLSPPPSASCQLADKQLLSSGAIACTSDGMVLTRHGRILAGTPLSLSHASALIGSHRFGCRVFDDMALLLSALNSTDSRLPKWAAFDAKIKKSTTSDHVALLGQIRSSDAGRVKKEADRLKRLVISEMGHPSKSGSQVAAGTDAELSAATIHIILACLLSSSSQFGKFENATIKYLTEVRMHNIRPHRSSVCSAAKNARGYAFFGSVIKLPAGPVATDVSVVRSDIAAAMFGNHSFERQGVELLQRFGRRVKDVFFGLEDLSLKMLLLLEILLGDLIPPWDGLPDGWEYDEESKLFKTAKGELCQRNKPTQPAQVAIAEKEKAKGSLNRAEKLLGGKKGRTRGEGPALITSTTSNLTKSKDNSIDNSDSVKKVTLAIMKQTEEGEKNEFEQRKGSKGVTQMLADLRLTEKYARAFEVAGIDDAALDDILLMNTGDEDDKAEGQKGVDELIKRCGLIGGSAMKVRKYLEGGKKVSGDDAKRGGKKKPHNSVEAPSTKAPSGKPKTKQKKKDNLSALENSLGGGGGKSKGRRGKKK